MILNTWVNFITPISTWFWIDKEILPMELIEEFKSINIDINKDNIWGVKLNENISDVQFRTWKEINTNSNSDNIELISFMTNTYDISKELLQIAKKYNIWLMYDFFEEWNEFAYRYYINKNGKFLEFQLENFDFDISSENIDETQAIEDYYLDRLYFKIQQTLEAIKIDDIITFYPELKHFINNYKILKIQNDNAYEYFILVLKNNYALEGLTTFVDSFNSHYKQDILKIDTDWTFQYILINKYEIMLSMK